MKLLKWLFVNKKSTLNKLITSFNNNYVINYGTGFYDFNKNKYVTHNVTHIVVDSFNSTVNVTIQKGLKINTINLSMEQAQKIGFINVKALVDYCH